MRQGEINLTVEVAQVHRELTAFRDQLLPALLGPCEAYLEDRARDPSRWPPVEQIEKSVRTLRNWQLAVNRLLDALPLTKLGAAEPGAGLVRVQRVPLAPSIGLFPPGAARAYRLADRAVHHLGRRTGVHARQERCGIDSRSPGTWPGVFL